MMKKIISFIFCNICMVAVFGQTPANDASWNPTLFFSDDFDATSQIFQPSSNSNPYRRVGGCWFSCYEYWEFNSSRITPLAVNGISAAQFSIAPATNPAANPCPPSSCSNKGFTMYSIGGFEVNTENIQFPYGYYEMRWDSPDLANRWVTWWLTNPTQEIDIIELGYGQPSTSATNHTMITNIHPPNGNTLPGIQTDVQVDFTTSYNTVGMEWTPTVILLYFNGKIIKEVLYNKFIPTRKLQMLLTPGVHCANANCNPTFSSADTDTKVDFIRVHTLLKDLSQPLVTINSSAALVSYKPMLRRNIIVDGSTNAISMSNSQKLTLRATESIVIQGDVNIPLGAELTLFPHPDPVNDPFY